MFLQRGLAAVQPLDHQPEPTHGQEILGIVHLGESSFHQHKAPAPGEHLPSHPQHPFPPALTSREFYKELKIPREWLWLSLAQPCPRAEMSQLPRHSVLVGGHCHTQKASLETQILDYSYQNCSCHVFWQFRWCQKLNISADVKKLQLFALP